MGFSAYLEELETGKVTEDVSLAGRSCAETAEQKLCFNIEQSPSPSSSSGAGSGTEPEVQPTTSKLLSSLSSHASSSDAPEKPGLEPSMSGAEAGDQIAKPPGTFQSDRELRGEVVRDAQDVGHFAERELLGREFCEWGATVGPLGWAVLARGYEGEVDRADRVFFPGHDRR